MNRGSLLLVDDDRQVLESMASWLRDQGYRVETASDAQPAIQLIDRKQPQLVLCDMRLRDGDGFQSCNIADRTIPCNSYLVKWLWHSRNGDGCNSRRRV